MIRRGLPWAVVVLLLAACGHQPVVQSHVDTPGSVSPSPALAGVGLGGEHLDIATFRGHPVVIYFWAAWCDPCRADQPAVNALVARYPSVHFIGDDIRDDLVSARSYVLQLKVPYRSVFDQSSVHPGPYHVAGTPTIIVVDGKGVIVGDYPGTVTARISQQLDVLLSNGG
jgi:thiol-disulfide isomerase/thioredoxin